MPTHWRFVLKSCAVATAYCAVAQALYDLAPATLFTTIPLGLLALNWLD